jgi:hypothetical protein
MFLNKQQPHHVDTRLRYNLYSEKGWSVQASDRKKFDDACDRALQRGTRGMFRFWGDTIIRADGVNPT